MLDEHAGLGARSEGTAGVQLHRRPRAASAAAVAEPLCAASRRTAATRHRRAAHAAAIGVAIAAAAATSTTTAGAALALLVDRSARSRDALAQRFVHLVPPEVRRRHVEVELLAAAQRSRRHGRRTRAARRGRRASAEPDWCTTLMASMWPRPPGRRGRRPSAARPPSSTRSAAPSPPTGLHGCRAAAVRRRAPVRRARAAPDAPAPRACAQRLPAQRARLHALGDAARRARRRGAAPSRRRREHDRHVGGARSGRPRRRGRPHKGAAGRVWSDRRRAP